MWFLAAFFLLIFLFMIVDTLARIRAGTDPWSRARQRKAAEQADNLLTQAEARLLCDQDAEAEVLLQSALGKAEQCDALLASQALDGLARLRIRHGDYASAVPLLERAVALEEQWPVSKPNYVALLNRMLAEARSHLGS